MFTEDQVIAEVKRLTGAESARIERWLSGSMASVLLSFPDGPDAYTFRNVVADASGDTVNVLGFGL